MPQLATRAARAVWIGPSHTTVGCNPALKSGRTTFSRPVKSSIHKICRLCSHALVCSKEFGSSSGLNPLFDINNGSVFVVFGIGVGVGGVVLLLFFLLLPILLLIRQGKLVDDNRAVELPVLMLPPMCRCRRLLSPQRPVISVHVLDIVSSANSQVEHVSASAHGCNLLPVLQPRKKFTLSVFCSLGVNRQRAARGTNVRVVQEGKDSVSDTAIRAVTKAVEGLENIRRHIFSFREMRRG